VSNLFPSIPPTECIPLVRNLLSPDTNLDPFQVEDLLALVSLVLDQNFFQFNNSFYSQVKGLDMGSCLFPLLAEIFMANLEQSLKLYHSFYKILFFRRYVDDIFCIFDGNLDDLGDFFPYINTLHGSIKFTVKLESANSLPFLDILLTRFSDHVEFSIYHKPTSTDCLIPYNSNHPYQKVAALNSFFHRLFSIPMTQHCFKEELSWIKTVATNNDFPDFLFNKIYYNHFNKFINKNLLITYEPKLSNYYSIPFLGPLSLQLRNIFKPFNITICFKVLHTSHQFLCNSHNTHTSQIWSL